MVRVGDLVPPAGRPGTLPAGTPDDRPRLTEKSIVLALVDTRSRSVLLKLPSDRAFGPRIDVGKTFEDRKDRRAPWVCPICHCDLIVPHIDEEAECAACAARGVLEGGQLVVSEDGRKRSIVSSKARSIIGTRSIRSATRRCRA